MYYAKNYLLQERLQFTAAHIDMNVAIFTGRVSFLSFFQPREKNKVESIVGCLNKTRKKTYFLRSILKPNGKTQGVSAFF
jgi:hypothetical protein